MHLLGGRREDAFDAELVLRLLRLAAQQSHESPSDPGAASNEHGMFSHHVTKLLGDLEADANVSEADIAGLEWAYFPLLRWSDRPARVLPKVMSREPAIYLQVLKTVYLPSEAGAGDPDAEDSSSTSAAMTTRALELLEEWSCIPGSDDDGHIDGARLEEWVRQSRVLCARAGRAKVGDLRIGRMLSASQVGDDGAWPAEPIREVLEITRSKALEEGFEFGLYNRRGVTVRMPDDGGEQERTLAARYAGWAKACALEWPRTSAVLDRIADSYLADAKREDEQVERRQWL